MGKKNSWRELAKNHIGRAIEGVDVSKVSEKEFRKILRDAYPWGERAMHPYKIWCDQVNRTVNTFYNKKDKKGKITAGPQQQTLF